MRLFTALDLPPEILLSLESLLAALRPEASIKWSPAENLHITTKFIGEWPDARLSELDACLQQLCDQAPMDVELRNLGWYPNAHAPRVLWAGVDGGSTLPAFAAQTEAALMEIGIAKDPHGFSPHLTLARIKPPVPLQRLRAKVEELHQTRIGHYRAGHFFLYRSDPGSHFSIYRKIRTYPFESKS